MCFCPLLFTEGINFPFSVGKLQSLQLQLFFTAIAATGAVLITAEAGQIEVNRVVATTQVAAVEAERKGSQLFLLDWGLPGKRHIIFPGRRGKASGGRGFATLV